jgi:hypothetical protein
MGGCGFSLGEGGTDILEISKLGDATLEFPVPLPAHQNLSVVDDDCGYI